MDVVKKEAVSYGKGQRVLRTTLQLIAGGAFGQLISQVAFDLGEPWGTYVTLVSALVVTIAQNYLFDEYGIRIGGSDDDGGEAA